MKQKQIINIYPDHIQKRIELLENAIDSNCLRLYNVWKSALEEAYLEGVIEYEQALMNYNAEIECANASLYSELEHIYKTCDPIKVVDVADIYFCATKQ